jgi:hypothetical protein
LLAYSSTGMVVVDHFLQIVGGGCGEQIVGIVDGLITISAVVTENEEDCLYVIRQMRSTG